MRESWGWLAGFVFERVFPHFVATPPPPAQKKTVLPEYLSVLANSLGRQLTILYVCPPPPPVTCTSVPLPPPFTFVDHHFPRAYTTLYICHDSVFPLVCYFIWIFNLRVYCTPPPGVAPLAELATVQSSPGRRTRRRCWSRAPNTF